MNESTDIMQTLKAATWELHEAAEHHPYQRAFVKGQLSRDAYTDYLSQMLLVHTALEAHLAELQSSPRFAEVIQPHHFRVPRLLEDLLYFEVNAERIHPFASPAALIGEVDESVEHDPMTVLGFHYVLEGSTNGSKFIARSVERALRLSPPNGTAYLNPHGALQNERWASFKQAMGALPFDPMQTAGIVEAAKGMFRGVVRISDELLTRLPTAVEDTRLESNARDLEPFGGVH